MATAGRGRSVGVRSHGIEFVRAGACRQCGACGCDKGPCPHHYKRDGRRWCNVYDRRHLPCEECGGDHSSCITFPNNPWIGVVRNGTCGYQFERADGGPMDSLPFLNGGPY